MSLPKLKKRYLVFALVAGLLTGAGGIAAAYFIATITGGGHAVVGTSPTLTAVYKSVTPADLYPAKSQTVTLTLKNTTGNSAHYTIKTSDYAIVPTATDVKNFAASTAKVATCKASWFSFATGTATGTVAANGTTTITVKVAMSNGTGTTGSPQTTCKNVQPSFTLKFAS
ncbi:MAG: hypothetical protein ACRDVP_03005 [Acidimicrobiales bacterium]